MPNSNTFTVGFKAPRENALEVVEQLHALEVSVSFPAPKLSAGEFVPMTVAFKLSRERVLGAIDLLASLGIACTFQPSAATREFIKTKSGGNPTEAMKTTIGNVGAKPNNAHSGNKGVPGGTPTFMLANRRQAGLLAKAMPTPRGGLIVLRGSTAKVSIEASLGEGDRELRQKLVREGKLRAVSDELMEFTQNVEFDSPSSAASIVNTCSRPRPGARA